MAAKIWYYSIAPVFAEFPYYPEKEDIMLASLTNINKFYNGNQVLNNVCLTIDETDKIGLVGNNG